MIIEFPFRKSFTDEQILIILNEGLVKKENEVIKYLYKSNYRYIQKMVISRGGRKNDVPDIFQDTLIVFYENVKSGKFKLNQPIKNYLYIIAQNKWINRQKKLKRITSLEHEEQLEAPTSSIVEAPEYNWNEYNIIDRVMNKLKPDCKMVLQLSIYQKMSMHSIAEQMGFKNDQIARNKKRKCLNYLRDILRKFPEDRKALVELFEKG